MAGSRGNLEQNVPEWNDSVEEWHGSRKNVSILSKQISFRQEKLLSIMLRDMARFAE